MITAAIGDADSSVRATARRAYWVLRLRFPDLAESVMGSLAPSMQVWTSFMCTAVAFLICGCIFLCPCVLRSAKLCYCVYIVCTCCSLSGLPSAARVLSSECSDERIARLRPPRTAVSRA